MKWARSWPRGWRGKASGSAHLSLTAPVAAPFLEALCQVLGHCCAADRGKVSGSARLSLTAPQPHRFWKRFAKCLAIALPLGRAQGAPCKTTPRSADGEAIALPFAAGPGRKRPNQWLSVHATGSPACSIPLASPLACAQQFCSARPVRAPKEEQCFAQG